MIYSVAQTQEVQAGQNVIFSLSPVRTASCRECCGWLVHDEASGLFTLRRHGVYRITYNADITSDEVTLISLTLKGNGESIGGSVATYDVTIVNNIRHVGNDIFVEVPCGTSKTITLSNNSASDITLSSGNITIEKIL